MRPVPTLFSASLHDGLFGVDDQIENHLLQLRGIGQGVRQAGIEHELHGNVFEFQFVGAQRQGPLDHFIQIDRAALRLGFPREQEKVLHDAAGALGFLRDSPGIPGRGPTRNAGSAEAARILECW